MTGSLGGKIFGGGLRLAGATIGLPLAGAVGIGMVPHLSKLSQFVAGIGRPEEQTAAATSTGTLDKAKPGTPGTPAQEATVDQNAALLALLEKLAAQSAEMSQTEQADRAKLYEKLIDPGLYAERAAIDLANYERQAELARQAGMEQTRELSRRKIESDTIAAWQGITQAQINANAQIGLGMMNLAYSAGVPNPNVLQAGASLAGQGRSGFAVPSSTIS